MSSSLSSSVHTSTLRVRARRALRPRSLALLVLALGVAGAFAWLGQWQLGRALVSPPTAEQATEIPVELVETLRPGNPLPTLSAGQMVTANGVFVPGDYEIIAGRDQDGQSGFWVVGHFVTEFGASVAVARGWSPEYSVVARVVEDTRSHISGGGPIVGRLLPSQGPQIPDRAHFANAAVGVLTTVSVAELANRWTVFPSDDVYAGYVVEAAGLEGLAPITSPPPEKPWEVNWLNVFYALEWVVFAGFALFFWYRLVCDGPSAHPAEGKARTAGARRAQRTLG